MNRYVLVLKRIIVISFSIFLGIRFFTGKVAATDYTSPTLLYSYSSGDTGNFGANGTATTVSSGDLDNDGYPDLAIGQNDYMASQGQVVLFRGNATAVNLSKKISGVHPGSRFGMSVLIADVNSDHIADLIVGSNNYPSANTGRLYIYFGGTDFFTRVVNEDSYSVVIDAEQAGSRFRGTDKPAVGDFNGDGWNDLAVGAYSYTDGANTATGRVYIFLGSATKWQHTMNAGTDSNVKITGIATDQGIGKSLRTADIDNDTAHTSDLLIATYRNHILLLKGRALFEATYTAASVDLDIDGSAFSGFGFLDNYDVGDLNGDGKTDLLVGGGSYAAFYDNAKLVSSSTLNAADYTFRIAPTVSEVFGSEVVLYDYNNDGKQDIVIGAYQGKTGYDSTGKLYLIDNSVARSLTGSVTISTISHQELSPYDNIFNSTATTSFGRDAEKNDYNRNGIPDLAIVSNFAGTGKLDIVEFGNGKQSVAIDSPDFIKTNTVTISGNALLPTNTYNWQRPRTLMTLGNYTNGVTTVYDWDNGHTGYDPSVFEHNGEYYMYYSGYSSGGRALWSAGLAKSTDLINWEKVTNNNCVTVSGNGCLFTKASSGWDATGIESQTVLYDSNAAIYKMWYGGLSSSTGRIGYATSPDGISWTRYTSNLCSGTTGNGCVLPLGVSGSWDQTNVMYPYVSLEGATYRMWYAGYDGSHWRIGYATSADGINWTKYAGNTCTGTTGDGCVFALGSTGSWDMSDVHSPSIYHENGTYYMVYVGRNATTNVTQIGLATSTDGISWTRYTSNPILTPASTMFSGDRFAISTPELQKFGSHYYIFYAGTENISYRPFVATSDDLYHWTKVNESLVNTFTTPLSKVQARINAGPWFDCLPVDGHYDSAQEQVTCAINDPLAEGQYNFQLRTVDTSGNVSSEQFFANKTITIDTSAPAPIITKIGDIDQFTQHNPLNVYLFAGHTIVSGTSEAQSMVYFTKGQHISALTTNTGTFSAVFSTDFLTQGENRISYYQIDKAGNKSSEQILNITVGCTYFPQDIQSRYCPSPSVTPSGEIVIITTPSITPTSFPFVPNASPTPTVTVSSVLSMTFAQKVQEGMKQIGKTTMSLCPIWIIMLIAIITYFVLYRKGHQKDKRQ